MKFSIEWSINHDRILINVIKKFQEIEQLSNDWKSDNLEFCLCVCVPLRCRDSEPKVRNQCLSKPPPSTSAATGMRSKNRPDKSQLRAMHNLFYKEQISIDRMAELLNFYNPFSHRIQQLLYHVPDI